MFNPEAPPPLTAGRWFNTTQPIGLADLGGKAIVLTAFQVWCSRPQPQE